MGGFDEIIVPFVIAGIVFVSIFFEIRNQAKLRNGNPKQPAKPVKTPPVESPVEFIEIQPTATTRKKKANIAVDMPGDSGKAQVTKPKDVAYDLPDGDNEAADAVENLRKAVIAHEILKRKF